MSIEVFLLPFSSGEGLLLAWGWDSSAMLSGPLLSLSMQSCCAWGPRSSLGTKLCSLRWVSFVAVLRALWSVGWIEVQWENCKEMWGGCTEQRHLSSVGKDWVGGEWSYLKVVGWFMGSFANLAILEREDKYSLRSWPYGFFGGDWVSLLKRAPLIPDITWSPWIFNFQRC